MWHNTVSQEIKLDDGNRFYVKYTIEYKGICYIVVGDRPFSDEIYFRRLEWIPQKGDMFFHPLEEQIFDDIYSHYEIIEQMNPAGQLEHYRISEGAESGQKIIECAPTIELLADAKEEESEQLMNKSVLILAIGASIWLWLKVYIMFLNETCTDIYKNIGNILNELWRL